MPKPLAALVLAGLIFISCADSPRPPGCTDPIGCVTLKSGAPVKIGVLQALSGRTAPLGLEQLRGLELAMEDRQGRILGHPIELQREDTGCTGEGGANAVLKILADPDMAAIFGTTCSGAARTAAHAMSEAGLTMVSGNNSAPFLTALDKKAGPDWHPGYFRTAANEEHAGRAAAVFAVKVLGIDTAAAINDGDIYTRGLTQGFIRAFESLGGRIVLDASINKGETVMTPVLTAVRNTRAGLLFFPLFQPEGNHMLLQARQMPGFKKMVFIAGGALIQSSFLEKVRESAKGVYFVGPAVPRNPASQALSARYRARYKVLPENHYFITAYDAATLLLTAIEHTAVQTGANGLSIGRQALRQTLYNTRDFSGVTGRLACDRFGDCANPAFDILCLDDPKAGIQGLLANVIFSFRPEN